jgi:hypothetical protein
MESRRRNLSDPTYQLTQRDLADAARVIYSLHNDPRSEAYFEIEGSVRQFAIDLRNNLPHLASGRFRTLTFIVNLNLNHWVTVVVAMDAGKEII